MRSKDDEELAGWVNPDDFEDVNTKKVSSSSDKESILTGQPQVENAPIVLTEKTRLKDSSSSSSSSSSGSDNNV